MGHSISQHVQDFGVDRQLLAHSDYSPLLTARHKADIHGQLSPAWDDRPVWPRNGR